VLQHLFKQLQSLGDLAIIEVVEGHYGVLGDHVAESDEGGLLIHVEQKGCGYI
jgi:hypothetical protein